MTGGRATRVLYATHTPVSGGASRSLLGLLRALPAGEVVATVASPAGELGQRVEDEGLAATVTLPEWRTQLGLGGLVGQLRAFRRLSRAIGEAALETGADVIHANGWPAALAAAFGGGGAPVIWHARDVPVRPAVVRLLALRCAAAVAVSEAVRGYLLANGFGPAQVDRVYNGISEAEVRPRRDAGAVREELALTEGAPLIVSAGWLVPWKRHDLIVEAMPRVLAWSREARLVIAGPEPAEHPGRMAALDGLARELGVGHAVSLVGYRRDLSDLLAAADMYVHAAEAEAFGRTVVEAMLLGRPVVVADAEGLVELVEHERSGLVVPAGSAEALAEGVLRLLGDAELARRCGAGAQARARRDFGPERMAQGVLNVYWRVRAGGRR